MTDGIQDVIQESKKNKYSAIWNNLSEADVISVWDDVARFVEKNMLQQKGVCIPGFGTFTFSQVKLEVGNNKFLLLQRPIFVLSEKFLQTHGLQQTKHTVPGGLPVVSLNMSQLSLDSPYDRDTVDACVRDIVSSLSRSIATKQSADFVFSGIGRFQVQRSKVKMKFFKTFVNAMDGSGKVVESLQGRPGTADSVMSERCGSRMSGTNTNLGFHRKLKELDEELPYQSAHLPAINEEEEEGTRVEVEREISTRECFPLEEQQNEARDFDVAMDECDVTEFCKSELPESAGNRVPLPVASVMSFTDDLLDEDGRVSIPFQRTLNCPVPSAKNSSRKPFPGQTVCPGPSDFRASSSAASDGNISPFHQRKKIPSPPGTASSCGHSNSGQELCYLCHQRARRNVVISFAEERRRREEEEDEVLQQFQVAKATSENIKDQERLLARRHENQKVAAFNLGVMEANAEKKQAKEDFTPSFVFQKRLLTPPQFLIQERYQKELESQIAAREAVEKKQKMDEDFFGRLEQVHLSEEIAAEKTKRLKEKAESREDYRRALSAQLRMKVEPIPRSCSPSGEPYFGKNDTDGLKMAERRRKAHELYREQVAAVEQRKREEILKRLEEQRREEDMLRRVKQECASDVGNKYEMLLKNRLSLESDWLKAAEAKRSRDFDQRLHDKAGSGLVHEQCDRYKRCRQCKRRVDNAGETNVWCETRYVPGTRIMV